MKRRNQKYDKIFSAGKGLFWKYGIKRVSVEEICMEGSVSKMTFYKYFKNKKDLAYAILKDLIDQGVEEYYEIMDRNITFKEKLEEIIKLKIKYSQNLSFEVIDDIYGENFPELKDLMEKASRDNLKIVKQDLTKAQDNGYIRKNLDLDFLMYVLNKSTAVLSDKEFKSFFTDPQDMIRELVEFIFFGIVERN